MTDNISDTITTIKGDLRAAMNGVAANAIRQSGSTYRLVYGVELPRLREIARSYTPERRLAQALWDDNIRETRMLAVMLYPKEEFDADMADIWADNLRNDEADLAGLFVMDLVADAPFAADKAFEWIADERELLQLCGFLTAARLMMKGAQFSPRAEAEIIDQATATLPTAYMPLRRAVVNALLRLEQSAPHLEKTIENIISEI